MLIVASSFGCSDDGPPYVLDAPSACVALRGLTLPASAVGLPTNGAAVTSSVLSPATDAMPEFCEVAIEIASLDSAAQPIKVVLALPSVWNERLMFHGGGGWNGTLASLTINGALHSGPVSIQRGYAVYRTDAGHTGNILDASFALNAEQLENYASAAVKKAKDAAAAVVLRRYGRSPAKTYAIGSSTGGRETMTLMQRYPDDVDAVLSNVPIPDWVPALLKHHAVNRAMRANDGAGWLDASHAQLLYDAQLSECDALDGLVDQIISNPRACTFDVESLLCVDATDRCLSRAQVDAMKVALSPLPLPYALSTGTSLHAAKLGTYFTPRYFGTTGPWNAGPWTTNAEYDAMGRIGVYSDGLVRYGVLGVANADTLSFDPQNPGGYQDRVVELSRLMDQMSPDISAFRDRGGKWILVQGTADQLAFLDASDAYYDAMVAQLGRAAIEDSVRNYHVVAYGHGDGPFLASNGMPTLDALETWVEEGIAPSDLVASDTAPGARRTRPMCRYPTWPRYTGSGDTSDAASFACVSE